MSYAIHTKKSFTVVSLALALTACNIPAGSIVVDVTGGTPDSDHSNGHGKDKDCDPSPSGSPSSNPNGQCFTERFQQPGLPVETNNKLDILFLTDTSGSLNEERGKVAKNIDAFVSALPRELDYRIGVMLQHGSRSSFTGKLYKKKNEPRVLDSKQMSVNQIRNYLYDKLIDPDWDYYADGGEEGLYSLAVTLDHGPLTSSRAQGFFRKDASLAVIFIADENDICAVYPAGVKPVRDIEGLEAPARARDCTRKAPAYPLENGGSIPAHNETITPELVYEKLKRLQGDRPLIVGAIAHTSTPPLKNGSEDEYGYGYLDLVSLAKGIAFDIRSLDYSSELAKVGTFTAKQIELQSKFSLSKENIDPASIHAFIDGEEVNFSYDAELNQVSLPQSGHLLSQVEINYCLKDTSGGNPSPTPSPSPTGTSSPEPTPSATPSAEPTSSPSPSPSVEPTSSPSPSPSVEPTSSPSPSPSVEPTSSPSPSPTSSPSSTPTTEPTGTPSSTPTTEPTSTPSPTPTTEPTSSPTPTPTCTGLDCGVLGV
jgi:hypothetical protein